MRSLIVGFGSIGARHARILQDMGHQVAVVSNSALSSYAGYTDVETALRFYRPDYVVIANRTAQHYSALEQLAMLNYTGAILVEKPLFHTVVPVPKNRFSNIFVAYNLRFHPLVQRLRRILEGQIIISVSAHVGQYLPEWRPKRNYIDGYSAHKAEGGGVLRDLSHELDYLNWLLGGWQRVVAVGGHYSSLLGDSEDAAGLLVEMRRCPLVMVHLNYLNRVSKRELLINTDEFSIAVDFIKGSLHIDAHMDTKSEVDRDFTYRQEHLAVITGTTVDLCSIEQGMEVLSLIDGAEQSLRSEGWVLR